MTKKELLIILILAGLINLILGVLVPNFLGARIPSEYVCDRCRGVPLTVYPYICGKEGCPGWVINIRPLVLDVIFWFLVLIAGWWVLKFVFKRTKKK